MENTSSDMWSMVQNLYSCFSFYSLLSWLLPSIFSVRIRNYLRSASCLTWDIVTWLPLFVFETTPITIKISGCQRFALVSMYSLPADSICNRGQLSERQAHKSSQVRDEKQFQVCYKKRCRNEQVPCYPCQDEWPTEHDSVACDSADAYVARFALPWCFCGCPEWGAHRHWRDWWCCSFLCRKLVSSWRVYCGFADFRFVDWPRIWVRKPCRLLL